MAKTYIPMAVDFASALHKRLTRYQAQLTTGATDEQVTALVELVGCLATFLANWRKPSKNP